MEFDFVVVGAGSAGCALAARLSEDGAHRVALLEAGPRDTNPWIHIPVGYFRTMGIEVLEGRALDRADTEGGQPVVVISRSLARGYFPEEDPLGRRVALGSDTTWSTVVGVVEDVRTLGMDVEPQPLLFFPLRQAVPEGVSTTAQSMSYVIRTSTPPTTFLPGESILL